MKYQYRYCDFYRPKTAIIRTSINSQWDNIVFLNKEGKWLPPTGMGSDLYFFNSIREGIGELKKQVPKNTKCTKW